MDSRDILTIKGLIRRGEARTASTYNQIPLNRVHFLDLPFYETGKIEKNPISEADVEIVLQLLRDVKPHQFMWPVTLRPARNPSCLHRRSACRYRHRKRSRCRMVERLPHLDVSWRMGGMGN